ncbi:MAG TPA: hypothetical protein DCW86_01790 [Actinobacteria bacterium]|nr:hypothetical protein [Actinomycetota bacterium]
MGKMALKIGCCGFPMAKRAYHAHFEVAKALGAKVILFQCPPSFRPTAENIDNGCPEIQKSILR